MKKAFLVSIFTFLFNGLFAQQTVIQYLSGTDKDHTVSWDFFCTTGMKSGKWASIPVPSNWELQGFGTYNYYRDTENPDEQGLYRHNFKIDPIHKSKKVFIVFEGSMTDTEVKINGSSAGPVHQGGFYQFKYDITDLVHFDRINLLEVTVSKRSANNSINRAERKADFWLFGGIFRPVYLEIVPPTFIERVAIDARANGDFKLNVYSNASPNQIIEAQVFKLNGQPVGKPIRINEKDSVIGYRFSGIQPWNPENPNLYSVTVSIKEGNKIIHSVKQRFGFRTVQLLESDGFYVNNVKVIFKGVCRHSIWPESGRTLSREIHLKDIRLMKSMNMNAVRMSHYPPDKEFLDLCDSLGLFVLDELTGWQAAYDTAVGRKLVKELVIRDVNHPSVVIWDNGNEGGWNRALDNDYEIYDPQKRIVIHPWEKFRGTNTKHYPDFKYIQNEITNGKDVFFPTEFMHGLFDGGHGAGLDDFWKELLKYNRFAGAFLWALSDEGVVRKDKKDSIDVAGNLAPDGITGPYREKEGSFYTIKEIWSPVYINTEIKPVDFNKIEVENRYLYTNLDKCRFEWKTLLFPGPSSIQSTPRVVNKGIINGPSVMPGKKGWLTIPVPLTTNADVLYISALDAKGDTICTWSWSLTNPSKIAAKLTPRPKTGSIAIKEDEQLLSVSCDKIIYYFNKQTGFIQSVFNGKKDISLTNGPSLAGLKQELVKFNHFRQGDEYIITPSYKGDSLQVKWIFQTGKLPRLEYQYMQRDTADFMGITFDFPEEKITGMKWMGRGPYRVWKNRLKGQQIGVWEKDYNNTITGENWIYPEFKGWHSELFWVTVENKEAGFTIITDQDNIFLQMLQPGKPKAAPNNNTVPAFANGSIGFMHAISAIGTKFQRAELMGPQSNKNTTQHNGPIHGALYFDFRDSEKTVRTQKFDYPFQNPTLDAEKRIDNIISLLTLNEKISCLGTNPSVPRLGIKASGHIEGLHGVALGGPGGWGRRKLVTTTTFPQSYGLAETWDTALIRKVAETEAYEARYIFQSEKYKTGNLVIRAPNADIGRDPRWGRTEECYGEDAWFNGCMTQAYVKGLQGNHPKYWMTASLMKHFLANSNENDRVRSSSDFNERLFREYYSVPFKMGIDAGSRAYMAAYNKYNGIPMMVHPILKEITIKEWGQNGIICNDGGALGLLWRQHKYYPDSASAAAAAVKAGINQFLDRHFNSVNKALNDGILTEKDIDEAIRGSFRVMIKLGLLDPPEIVPYASIKDGEEPWLGTKNKEFVKEVTKKSIVLLKNQDSFLPIDRTKVKSLAIIGPYANQVLLDWYSGTPPYTISSVEGIKNKLGNQVFVQWTTGKDADSVNTLARTSDYVIMVVGNHTWCNAGWEQCPTPSDGKEAVDRKTIYLEQEDLIRTVYHLNPKTMVVLIASFPYAITWTQHNIPAIVHLTHNSQELGSALADVLFGDYNPAGRLVQTWPRSMDQLPSMMDYDIRNGRTYMYFKGAPLYPFGYGLSYTTFKYSNFRLSSKTINAKGEIIIAVDITNTGKRNGDEVIQLYIEHLYSTVSRPAKELKAFKRVTINAGETITVKLGLKADQLNYWDDSLHQFVIENDKIKLMLGSSSDDIRFHDIVSVIAM